MRKLELSSVTEAGVPGPTAVPAARLNSLDALRGLAVGMVVCCHLLGMNGHFAPQTRGLTDALASSGITLFFVVSGFVIPYAMHRSGYVLRDYGRFLWKRLLRLHPPYIAAIGIILGLNYASSLAPGFRGQPFQVDFGFLLEHFVFLNAFLSGTWYCDVFWTLAVEFQWYLFIGLVLPLVAARRAGVRLASLALIACLPFAAYPGLLFFHWLFPFLFGLAAFQFKVNLLSPKEFLAMLLPLAAAGSIANNPFVTAMSAITACAIAFASIRSVGLTWLGTISYSLYLLHVPLGVRVINLSERFPQTLVVKTAAFIMGAAASLAGSYLLWKLVERPAQAWSSRVVYPGGNRPALSQKLPAV